jgi:hypothetical protein
LHIEYCSVFFGRGVLLIYKTYGVIVVLVYLGGDEKSSSDGLDGFINSLKLFRSWSSMEEFNIDDYV